MMGILVMDDDLVPETCDYCDDTGLVDKDGNPPPESDWLVRYSPAFWETAGFVLCPVCQVPDGRRS